jgi:hypothetical protein
VISKFRIFIEPKYYGVSHKEQLWVLELTFYIGRRGDLHTVDLAIKFFNTYLRAAINISDVRTVYNVLYQYRQLGEWIITYGKEIADSKAKEENDLELRAVKIAKFMRYSMVFFGGSKRCL